MLRFNLKYHFICLKVISQSFILSPVIHPSATYTLLASSQLSVLGTCHISHKESYLKNSSHFCSLHLILHSTIHSCFCFVYQRPFCSIASLTGTLLHALYMSELFSLLDSALNFTTSQHFISIKQAILLYPFILTLIRLTQLQHTSHTIQLARILLSTNF